ncbi:hypothetical protein PR202_ga30302 [Eleusine coracana subsp. coracana]|uniref:KIB1-4 beta-propeller domain-containing protein n=1 Tax=Eleusine coracana subsp. coracana TaxID=191504 RepID=A0AAV5DM61_ELECO|nr:hypothetical protein PR202_ga30302 [Eleusine coracana subsp. coracana]
MLVFGAIFGVPAFATSEDPNWRLAPSRDDVKDAVCHDSRFYSITYSGVIEAWEADGGDTGSTFISTEAVPKLNLTSDDGVHDDEKRQRKYLAAALDGRFMVVVKESMEFEPGKNSFRKKWTCVFKCEAALFIGVNGSMCVSTKDNEQPGIKASRHKEAYYYSNVDEELKCVGVYNLTDGKVETIIKPNEHPRWPLPACFTPSAF